MNIVRSIRKQLEEEIKSLPQGFYDSFEYTTTGKNLTHPVTLGFLVKILWGLSNVARIGIDVRLNVDGLKFYPDIVAFDDNGEAVLLIDYESPNSSDMRVPAKDVKTYIEWCRVSKKSPPYIIVTTLPNAPSPKWQLRYTTKLNKSIKGKREAIRKNPFEFWQNVYSKKLAKTDLQNIYFLNISGKKVHKYNPTANMSRNQRGQPTGSGPHS